MEKCDKHYTFLSDYKFNQISHTLDNHLKDRAKSVTVGRRQSESITVEEDALWSQLLHTLLSHISVNFALKGGEEHLRMRVGGVSQLSIVQFSSNRKVLRYSKDVSKANQGGIKHRKISPKVVDAFASDNSERCIIWIYKAYMGH